LTKRWHAECTKVSHAMRQKSWHDRWPGDLFEQGGLWVRPCQSSPLGSRPRCTIGAYNRSQAGWGERWCALAVRLQDLERLIASSISMAWMWSFAGGGLLTMH